MVICLGLGMVKACAGGDGSEWKEKVAADTLHVVHYTNTAGFTTDNDRSCGTCGLLRETLLGWLSDR